MNDNREILCIYHGNCADGFGAAWAVWKRFPNAIFHAGVYGEVPPDTFNKHVVLVDFSYPPEVLKKMAKKAASMLILDHHKSAKTAIDNFENKEGQLFIDISDWSRPLNWERHLGNVYQDQCEGIPTARIYTLFDMEQSGAMLAFRFFHPEKTIPAAISHIQDRDLWRFKIEGTREFQAALFSYPYEFETWDMLFKMSAQTLIEEGRIIERKHFKDIAELLKVNARHMNIAGHWVWCANLPYTMASDACHEMCKWPIHPPHDDGLNAPLTPFSACYYDAKDKRVFSLRSEGDFDVSIIAQKYGGGGHKNASGFSVPIGWGGEND